MKNVASRRGMLLLRPGNVEYLGGVSLAEESDGEQKQQQPQPQARNPPPTATPPKRDTGVAKAAARVGGSGAGLHTASSCYWDNSTDGSCTVRWENKTMYCIVSVFGLAI